MVTGLIQATQWPRENDELEMVRPLLLLEGRSHCSFLETQAFHQPLHWFWLPLLWPQMVWGCLWKVFVAKSKHCGRFRGRVREGGRLAVCNFNFFWIDGVSNLKLYWLYSIAPYNYCASDWSLISNCIHTDNTKPSLPFNHPPFE